MEITFVGAFSLDINVVGGVARHEVGGGVFYGSIAAARLGARTRVITRCRPQDASRFSAVQEAGVEVVCRPSETSTSIRNDYPSSNPDERITRMISRAESFSRFDLEAVHADVMHVNPLWYGEFPPALLKEARSRARVLAADAQGFVRNVFGDLSTGPRDWPEKRAFLPLIDVFKVDAKEARALTGISDFRSAARDLHEMGVRTVLLTHQDGLCVNHDGVLYQAPFTGWTLEGRTGRGDTCAAAWLVSMDAGPAEATRFAAHATSAKMRYPGALRLPLPPV